MLVRELLLKILTTCTDLDAEVLFETQSGDRHTVYSVIDATFDDDSGALYIRQSQDDIQIL